MITKENGESHDIRCDMTPANRASSPSGYELPPLVRGPPSPRPMTSPCGSKALSESALIKQHESCFEI